VRPTGVEPGGALTTASRAFFPAILYLRYPDSSVSRFARNAASRFRTCRVGYGPFDLLGCDCDRPIARMNRAGLLRLLLTCALTRMPLDEVEYIAPSIPYRAPDFDELAAVTGGALALDRAL